MKQGTIRVRIDNEIFTGRLWNIRELRLDEWHCYGLKPKSDIRMLIILTGQRVGKIPVQIKPVGSSPPICAPLNRDGSWADELPADTISYMLTGQKKLTRRTVSSLRKAVR